MALTVDRKVRFTLGGTLILLVAVSAMTTIGVRRLLSDAAWVAHSHEVRAELRTFESRLSDAKADVRGLLLTADSTYGQRLAAHLDSADHSYARLERVMADNPSQRRRLAEPQPLLDQRKRALFATAALRTQSAAPAT